MGGIVSAPKAPTYAPLPELKAQPEAQADDSAARLEEIDRRRRGRAGTVQTSERGLIRVNATRPQKKSLLGE